MTLRIFSIDEINYLNNNTTSNLDVEVAEDLFFTKFSLKESEDFDDRIIMNQGEICNYMNLHFSVQISKYDIKRIVLKHKMEMKTHSFHSKPKKGYEIFKEFDYKNEKNAPF